MLNQDIVKFKKKNKAFLKKYKIKIIIQFNNLKQIKNIVTFKVSIFRLQINLPKDNLK